MPGVPSKSSALASWALQDWKADRIRTPRHRPELTPTPVDDFRGQAAAMIYAT
jgi:hypothetical protein